MYRGNTRTSEKCIACYPRVEGKDPESGGQPMETRCMAACIGQIRMQGLVEMNEDGTWTEDRHNPLYYLVHVAKVALPLYPQFGTEPNGYYIPPRWVPRAYLRQMFGPGVDDAIEHYIIPRPRAAGGPAAVPALEPHHLPLRDQGRTRRSTKRRCAAKRSRLYNDTVIAYGKDGKEIFRTQVEEPVHVRPDKHANSI